MSLDTRRIDARGLSCPQPVLLTKKALAENPAAIEIQVSNTAAKENVGRFLEHSGYQVDTGVGNDEFIIMARKK